MYDPMDHLPRSLLARKKGEVSVLRRLVQRAHARRELTRFAKYFLIEYLNSKRDVDDIVEDWLENEEQ